MPLILNIETATRVCSVTLARGSGLVVSRESREPNVHSSMLTVFIEEMMAEAGLSLNSLDAVAVSMGPGSYTGLRIGVAASKGFCYALDKPLIAIPTLQAMAYGISFTIPHPASPIPHLLSPMIDARRMEVYCALYNEQLAEVREVRAEIISEDSFADFLKDHIVVFGGDGAEKCRQLLGAHPNAIFTDNFETSSTYMTTLALEKFSNGEFENLAYFEPFYLKDFVAGKPRVKGLTNSEIAK